MLQPAVSHRNCHQLLTLSVLQDTLTCHQEVSPQKGEQHPTATLGMCLSILRAWWPKWRGLMPPSLRPQTILNFLTAGKSTNNRLTLSTITSTEKWNLIGPYVLRDSIGLLKLRPFWLVKMKIDSIWLVDWQVSNVQTIWLSLVLLKFSRSIWAKSFILWFFQRKSFFFTSSVLWTIFFAVWRFFFNFISRFFDNWSG